MNVVAVFIIAFVVAIFAGLFVWGLAHLIGGMAVAIITIAAVIIAGAAAFIEHITSERE